MRTKGDKDNEDRTIFDTGFCDKHYHSDRDSIGKAGTCSYFLDDAASCVCKVHTVLSPLSCKCS